MTPRANPPIAILGVPFDNVTMAEAAAAIEKMVASRRPQYVVTANVDFLAQARQDVELRRILFDAHLVLCDGTPIVWASRLLGNPLPERVAGSDLAPVLIRMAWRRNLRVFFLGGSPQSIQLALTNLKTKYPGLAAFGYSPPFNPLHKMNHGEIKRRIVEAAPDLLFVSFGCPKQEKWIAMNYQSLDVPVTVGVGGTIDFLAGQLKRAPGWMQRTGTEWFYRMMQEPRRLFGRYARDLWVFGRGMFAQWRQLHTSPAQTGRGRSSGPAADWQWIQPPNRLDFAAVKNHAAEAEQILADGRPCLLAMDKVSFIDSTGVGWLIRLQKKLRADGRQLVLLDPSAMVKRALALMRLRDFFPSAPDLDVARKLTESPSFEADLAVMGDELMWRGEITAANADAVWRMTERRIATADTTGGALVIDMSRVRFIDSTGLGVMMRARRLARRRGVMLTFTGAQPAVRNVLHLARLEPLLLKEAA